jgi:hypothetical protein
MTFASPSHWLLCSVLALSTIVLINTWIWIFLYLRDRLIVPAAL